jgi:hypothetical protein
LNSQLRGLCEGLAGDVQLSCLYAATSLFFFLSASSCSGASLVGSEKNDTKGKKMPYMRWICFRYGFHWHAKSKIRMPKMWQQTQLERWYSRQHLWRNSALSLSKVWLSVFRTVDNIPYSPLFFGSRTTGRVTS